MLNPDFEKERLIEAKKLSLSHLFKGLDDLNDDIIDLASKNVHEVLLSAMGSGDFGWKMFEMLEKLHAKEPGFTYVVVHDPNGACTGVVWMMPMIYSAFEWYGCFLSIVVIKHKLNKLN